MGRKIVVTINNLGETQVEAVGYVGGTCMKATQPFVDALIGKPVSDTKKPEFYQGQTVKRVEELESR